MVHSRVGDFPLKTASCDEIKRATENDQVLQRLRNIIKRGWPDKCSAVPKDIKPYWHLRDEAEHLLEIEFVFQPLWGPRIMQSVLK